MPWSDVDRDFLHVERPGNLGVGLLASQPCQAFLHLCHNVIFLIVGNGVLAVTVNDNHAYGHVIDQPFIGGNLRRISRRRFRSTFEPRAVLRGVGFFQITRTPFAPFVRPLSLGLTELGSPPQPECAQLDGIGPWERSRQCILVANQSRARRKQFRDLRLTLVEIDNQG